MATLIPAPTVVKAPGNIPKLSGTLRVETRPQTFEVTAGQAIVVKAGEWVRYSSPSEAGAQYVAVCTPAFSPDTVHRDE